MQIVGKKFFRGSDRSQILIPSDVDGDYVIFNTGARCKLSTFFQEFNEIDSVNNIVESGSININSNTEIDPDTFFLPKVTEQSPILNQLESALKGQNTNPSEKLRQSQSLDGIKEKGSSLGLASRFTDNGSTVRPVNEEYKPLEIKSTTSIENKPTNRLPEWDAFDRVKKTETVEFNIPIKLKLPSPDKIKAVDDMFDSSYIAYIAKSWIDSELSGRSKSLVSNLQLQIRQWTENDTKKTTKKQVKKTSQQPITSKAEPIGQSANEFFGKGKISNQVWDGDVNSLSEITSTEQLSKVKARLKDETNENEKAQLEMLIINWSANNPS